MANEDVCRMHCSWPSCNQDNFLTSYKKHILLKYPNLKNNNPLSNNASLHVDFSWNPFYTSITVKMRITKNHKSLLKKKSKSLLHNFSFEIKGCWLKSIVWSFWNHLILFILFLFVWPNILKMLWIKKYSM